MVKRSRVQCSAAINVVDSLSKKHTCNCNNCSLPSCINENHWSYYTHVCISVHIHKHMRTCTHAHRHVHTHTQTHTYIHTCTVCTHTCMHACMHAHYTYASTWTYSTHIHTHRICYRLSDAVLCFETIKHSAATASINIGSFNNL